MHFACVSIRRKDAKRPSIAKTERAEEADNGREESAHDTGRCCCNSPAASFGTKRRDTAVLSVQMQCKFLLFVSSCLFCFLQFVVLAYLCRFASLRQKKSKCVAGWWIVANHLPQPNEPDLAEGVSLRIFGDPGGRLKCGDESVSIRQRAANAARDAVSWEFYSRLRFSPRRACGELTTRPTAEPDIPLWHNSCA